MPNILRTGLDTRTALVAGVALPLLVFALLASQVVADGTFALDPEAVDLADRLYGTPVLVPVAKGVVYAGIVAGALLALAILGALLVAGRRKDALFWALVVSGVLVLDTALKPVFQRPALGDGLAGYSFPSGNAMASVALLAGLAMLAQPGRLRWALTVAGPPIVAAYGAALVILLWHYPSDVLAGWCAAVALVTGLRLAIPSGSAIGGAAQGGRALER